MNPGGSEAEALFKTDSASASVICPSIEIGTARTALVKSGATEVAAVEAVDVAVVEARLMAVAAIARVRRALHPCHR